MKRYISLLKPYRCSDQTALSRCSASHTPLPLQVDDDGIPIYEVEDVLAEQA